MGYNNPNPLEHIPTLAAPLCGSLLESGQNRRELWDALTCGQAQAVFLHSCGSPHLSILWKVSCWLEGVCR